MDFIGLESLREHADLRFCSEFFAKVEFSESRCWICSQCCTGTVFGDASVVDDGDVIDSAE